MFWVTLAVLVPSFSAAAGSYGTKRQTDTVSKQLVHLEPDISLRSFRGQKQSEKRVNIGLILNKRISQFSSHLKMDAIPETQASSVWKAFEDKKLSVQDQPGKVGALLHEFGWKTYDTVQSWSVIICKVRIGYITPEKKKFSKIPPLLGHWVATFSTHENIHCAGWHFLMLNRPLVSLTVSAVSSNRWLDTKGHHQLCILGWHVAPFYFHKNSLSKAFSTGGNFEGQTTFRIQ